MLSNNNHSTCAFGEQIVSYIYDEASAKERHEFESHLPNCLSCAEEIAGFGLVRSSISEWRKDEFFTLESPALEIPALRPVVVASEKNSWFDEFRKLFSISPAWATGFAALILSIGLVWIFFGSSQNDFVASNKSVEVPTVAPIVVNKTVEQPKEEKVSVNPKDEKVTDVPKNDLTTEQKPVLPKNQVVKASNTAPKVKSVTPKTNNSMAVNKSNKNNKSNTAQKQSAPTLTEMKDDEDNSLRLSEIFDEIDTK